MSEERKKTVLVTGASRGIGRAIAVLFAENGYNVVINYNKNKAAAESLAAELISKGVDKESLLLFRADVGKTAEVSHMLAATTAKFGQIDVLVNNAGISKTGLLTDMKETDWDELFEVNVKALFNTCRLALPQMINRKWGRIINISSMWGQVGASCEVAYSAAKGAVDAFTKALAQEVGPSGITVNAVSPGFIDTEMNGSLTAEDVEQLIYETPLERIGKPQDVAEAVLFLASDKAEFITGQIIPVNGGLITTA